MTKWLGPLAAWMGVGPSVRKDDSRRTGRVASDEGKNFMAEGVDRDRERLESTEGGEVG